MDESKRVTPDERRHHILDVAHRAFIRDGYAGTSMSRIAAELGGSKTTLYNYFASKKELFVAVADRECARLFDDIFALEEEGGDFLPRITTLARRLLTAMLSDDMIASYRLIVAESGRFPEIGITAFEMGVKRGAERLSLYFHKAIADGEMRRTDALLAATQFVDLASGMLHQQRIWNVVPSVSGEMIAREAGRIANTFVAAFGNERLSAAARQSAG